VPTRARFIPRKNVPPPEDAKLKPGRLNQRRY